MSTFTRLQDLYDTLIGDRRRDLTFIVLLFFLPTFILARILVYLDPSVFINIRGTHIHHLTWGILLLALSGYLALVARTVKMRRRVAALYGIALALAFDEFGMWLRLKDDYYVRQSYDAILIITAWLVNTVYFADYWERLFHLIPRFTRELRRP